MHNFFKNKNLTYHLVVFFVLCTVILTVNFPFNSLLTGWDNLHPEFNFSLNLSRGINSVWQDNQGLGTYGGHGYAATLLHTLFLFMLSPFMPDMYLRSVFTFFCLFAGGLGIFFLLRYLLKYKNETLKNSSALLASFYYMLNFGTVQNFYIQLEAFIVQFAALPWLFLTLFLFLEKHSKKRLVYFCIVSLLASIQGFIPPLFFVYLIILFVFLFVYCVSKISFQRIKIAFLILLTTFIINAYWLLPVVNYSLTRSSSYLNAYNNLSSTEDFILKNQNYGNVHSLVTLKGFISEAIDSSDGGSVFLIFSQWLQHLSKAPAIAAGYILFAIIIVGLIFLVKNRKIPLRWGLLIGFITTFSLLATDTPPFSFVTKLMQEIPVLKQAFRVAFTKFSLSLGFFYAIFFGLGVAAVLDFIGFLSRQNRRIKNISSTASVVCISAIIIYFSLPTFTGYFIYPRTKINIPVMYYQLFDFFKTQEKTDRIANLPQGWNWGWSIYNWGYSGSGFLWYGIQQPIMDRSFDVWGKSNEQYYWELSHIIYSENYQDLHKLFEKYGISWVIIDKNVIPYLNARGALYSDRIDSYLTKSPDFSLAKEISSTNQSQQSLKIYKVNNITNRKTIASYSKPTNALPPYSYATTDYAFTEYGNYISDTTNENAVYYPYRSLFSNSRIGITAENISPDSISTNSKYISIKTSIPEGFEDYLLTLPTKSEVYEALTPTAIERDDNSVTVKVQLTSLQEYSYQSEKDPFFLNHNASGCKSVTLPSDSFTQETVRKNILRFSSVNSENCYNIILPQLFQRYGYVIEIDSRYITGKKLQFAVINNDSKKAEIEYALTNSPNFEKTYVFLPPMKFYAKGYSLIFNNISIGKSKTINELKSVRVFPFPYDTINDIKLVPPNITSVKSGEIISNLQAYDQGWKAYEVTNNDEPITNNIKLMFPFWFGTELKDHVLVNNWANGWKITSNDEPTTNNQIVIVFLPQYLQYAGFVMLGGMILVIAGVGLKSRYKHPQTLS